MTTVRIIDYGIGNLHSVRRAFEIWSDDVKIVESPAGLGAASHVVLPGVGAFGPAMQELETRGFRSSVIDLVNRGRPTLGLCVGMQILADQGFENGLTAGLGLIPGKVLSLGRNKTIRVPNIGWRKVRGCQHDNPLLPLTDEPDFYYFAHSFELVAHDQRDVAALIQLGTYDVVAAVRRDNLWGVQFHPEKSDRAGLELLKRFLRET